MRRIKHKRSTKTDPKEREMSQVINYSLRQTVSGVIKLNRIPKVSRREASNESYMR